MTNPRPKVVVALLTREQEYQQLQAEDARAVAARLGLDLDVVFADNSAILQIQQLYKVIHRPAEERPKAIVVETVVGEGLERVARAATQAGIGWVLVNRRVPYLDALRASHPTLPVAAVGTDQVEVGRLQARQFRALIRGDSGVVLYIQGPPDTSAAQERLKGAQEGLAGSRIELKLLDGDWTEQSGATAVERWLRLKTSEGVQPSVIGCQNDSMAAGARRALEAQRHRPELATVPLTGCDGLPQGGKRLVDLRRLAATVVTLSNTGPALELVATAVRDGKMPPREVLMKPTSYPEVTELTRMRSELGGARSQA
jgi:ABC-type sugar transport system substrate-binding protein